MFLLDTNILSEMMRATPAPELLAWLSDHDQSAMVTAAICVAEILAGIAILPDSRRKASSANKCVSTPTKMSIKTKA